MQDPRIHAAAELAERYGGIDGEHHKQWLIDQLLRTILGDAYDAWVAAYNRASGCEAWDTGTAP